MSEYRVGDRVKAVHRFSETEVVTYEFIIRSIDRDGGPSGVWITLDEISPYSNWGFEVIERAPIPEPTNVGAVVQFEDPLERITQTATHIGGGRWVDQNMKVWSWKVIAANDCVVCGPGVDGP